MPADPIDLRIVRKLRDQFAAITVGGGYHFDVLGTAVRFDPDHDVQSLTPPDGPRPFVLLEVRPDRWEYPEKPNGARIVLPVTVNWVHESSEDTFPTDETRLLTYLKGCADIEQAMGPNADGTIWHEGLAANVTIRRRTMDLAVNSSLIWALIDVDLVVRREFWRPNG